MHSSKLSYLILLLFVCSLATAQQSTVNLTDEIKDDKLIIYADNPEPFPQTAELALKLTGLKPPKKMPRMFAIPANSFQYKLLEIPVPAGKEYGYGYSFISYMGDLVNGHHDKNHAYRLPYEAGKSFQVIQGYNGKTTHKKLNALDFDMPEGTTIVAARKGTVVRVKEDSNVGCARQRCMGQANYVTILHDDGSFADYAHLKQDGVIVALGDKVEAGDPIGYSGNTGFSSGPHLHFMVFVHSKKGNTTMPTKFITESGDIILKELASYKAVN